MAELNVGTVVAGLELRDDDFNAAIAAAGQQLRMVEAAAEAAGAATAQAMAPASASLDTVAQEALQATQALDAVAAEASQAGAAVDSLAAEAARATQALQAMAATPMQRIAMAANEAAREIDRLAAVSGNAAAADAARAALAQRTAAAMGQMGKQTAAAAKATTNWSQVGMQSFYQISDAASQLSAGTPFTTVLIQQGGQLLPVLASVGGALMSVAAILGPVAVAAGALGVAYAYLARDADKANAAVEANRKILEQWQAAAKSTGGVIDDDLRRQIAVANGEMTDSAAAAEKAAAAYQASKQPLLDAAAAQVQMAQATADAIRAQVMGKAETQRAGELMLIQSDRYRDAQATVEGYRKRQQQLADQISQTADVVGTLAEKEILEAEAGKASTEGHKAAAKALKDHAREAKEAEAALRAFVALYEQAADAVYARKEVPGADLFARAQKLMEEMVPPKALSAMERLDMLAADVAAQFSRGLIQPDQFAQLESMLTAGKAQKYAIDIGAAMAEQSRLLADAQREAAAAMGEFVAGLRDKLMGNLGKLGSMIQSVIAGAESGGVWGAIIAGAVELVGSNLKLQRAMDTMNTAFEQLAEVFDPVIEVIHMFGATDTKTLKAAFDALGPVFDTVAQAIQSFAPFAAQLGTFFQILGPIFSFLMQAIQPLLSIVDTLSRTLFGLTQSVFQLVGTILGAVMQSLQPLAPLFMLLEITLRPIFMILDLLVDGLKMLFDGLSSVVQMIVGGIDKAYNWIIDQIEKLLKAIGIEVDIPRMDMGAMWSAMDDLAGQTYDAAMATAEQNAAVTESTEGFDKLNESLSNVPTGFKVAKKALDAMNAAIQVSGTSGGIAGYVTPAEGLGYGSRQTVAYTGGGGTYLPGADRGGGVTIYIDRLEVRADDPDSLIQQLSDIAGRKLFSRTGSTVGTGLPFASMQVP